MMPKHTEKLKLPPDRSQYLLYLADLLMLQVSFLVAVVLYYRVNNSDESFMTTLTFFAGWPNLVVTIYWLTLLTISRTFRTLFPRNFYGEVLRAFNVISLGIVIMLFAILDATNPRPVRRCFVPSRPEQAGLGDSRFAVDRGCLLWRLLNQV